MAELAVDARTVVHPRTGEVVEFVDTGDPDVLTMLVTWPDPGHRAAEHLHPRADETWHVLEGRVAFVIGGEHVEAGPGETVTAPAGTRHLASNAGDGAARLRIEMRPGLRWEQFVRRCFAGEDPVRLLGEFRGEIVLPTPTGHERRRERGLTHRTR